MKASKTKNRVTKKLSTYYRSVAIYLLKALSIKAVNQQNYTCSIDWLPPEDPADIESDPTKLVGKAKFTPPPYSPVTHTRH